MPKKLAPLLINPDLRKWLEDKNQETGKSYSDIVRDAIRTAMEKDKRKGNR
jgi:Arc/MetJ-type ribon-helix-helix transcriptional regulator